MLEGLIYDVGMNTGDDTAYYLSRGFKVLAIEADPTLCASAAARFRDPIEQGRLTVLNLGIAATPGTLDFWICESRSVWSSFNRSIASRDGSPHHSVPVPCQTFDWVLRRYGTPYYLKIDIEGNDRLCIEALEAGDLPRYVSIEVGDVDRVVERLAALGYTGFKAISQFNFFPLQVPPVAEAVRFERWDRLSRGQSLVARALCRVYGRRRISGVVRGSRQKGDWTFPEGSSGPFGEETLGRWLGAQELHDTYHHYFQLFQRGERTPFWGESNYSFWVDLHARMGRPGNR